MENLNKVKNNSELQKDIQDALKWEPLLTAAEIGVTVRDGIVTLTGSVDNYAKKTEAENTAKNVAGVKAVVEQIKVIFGTNREKTSDGEIAMEILSAFKWNWRIPNDRVKVVVVSGWVTLEGELEYNYQIEAAKNAVKDLSGITGVTNNTKLKSDVNEAIAEADIESALKRNWSIFQNDIDIKVSDHKAILTGTVDSWYQKEEAGRITLNAPGVWTIDNELVVDYDYSLMGT